MYENELALTGMSAIVIGPIVLDAWWAAAILIGAGALALVFARRLHRRNVAK